VAAERFIYGVCSSLSKSTAKQPHTTPEEQAAQHGLDVEQADMIDGGGFVRFLWKGASRPSE
jgi:hypothetical protein